jgi:hypothetical protein
MAVSLIIAGQYNWLLKVMINVFSIARINDTNSAYQAMTVCC